MLIATYLCILIHVESNANASNAQDNDGKIRA